MAPHEPSRSRLLVTRTLLGPAGRAVAILLERLQRLPAPVQRLGASTLHALASRWPLLARLLGRRTRVPSAEPVGERATTPSDALDGARTPAAAAPAQEPAQGLDAIGVDNVRRVHEAKDYAERARAARALGSVAHAEATAALIRALRDRSAEVAAQAAESLGRLGGDAAVAALRDVVENRDGFFSPAARASAVRALGALLPAGHASPITAAVSDVDAVVSLAAIAALAERDETMSSGALMALLEDRRGYYLPLTRLAAARALLRLRSYDRDRLRGLLEREADTSVRDALSSLAN